MRKNKIYVLLFLMIIMILGVSCSKETIEKNPVNEVDNAEEKILGLEEGEEQQDDPNKVVSPLDGLKYYPSQLLKRPVAVSLDNHPGARWQAGLKDAEIVYEFQVEYPYTRYLAIFLAKDPERVGPVRSARPYIIYYAMENDAIFVHVGGSEDAFAEIKRLGAPDVDGLYSGALWRYNDTNKKAPHNMYTNLKSIRAESERLGHRSEGNIEKYNFNEKGIKLSQKYNAVSAKNINITYNKENTTDYIYNEELARYLRFKDKEMHIDELDNKQLSASNIIVLEAPKSVLDNEGRLSLETIGKGNGMYFTQGEFCEINWVKDSEKDRTKFYIDDDELYLNPGNTWIQIVDSINCITAE